MVIERLKFCQSTSTSKVMVQVWSMEYYEMG
jgi:hypothetical protein